jgi:hypothetical protein
VQRVFSALRKHSWNKQLAEWGAVKPKRKTGRGVGGLDVVRLLVWGERVVEQGRLVSGSSDVPFAGFSLNQLTGGPEAMGLVKTRDPQKLWQAAERQARKKHRAALVAALQALQQGPEPLIVQDEVNGIVRWRANGTLLELLARGPPEFAQAFLNAPVVTLEIEGLRRMTGADLSKALFGAVRAVVFEQTAMRAAVGWRAWVPGVLRNLLVGAGRMVAGWFGRGRGAELTTLMAPVGAAADKVSELRAQARQHPKYQRLLAAGRRPVRWRRSRRGRSVSPCRRRCGGPRTPPPSWRAWPRP